MRKLSAKWLTASIFSVFLLAMGSAQADEDGAVSPWNQSVNSRARLLAAGPPQAGLYVAGIEIDLKSGAHTYWRDPGDAGVPPNLSTEGSRNVKSAILRFPAPMRIDENGLSVNGYRQSLVLPLDVTPVDATAPVHLALLFTYAACEKICVPAELSGTLDLKPDAPPSASQKRLEDARSLLPQPDDSLLSSLAIQSQTRQEKPVWHIALTVQPRDLFVEGPSGWFFDTRRSETGFEITAAERPADWAGPVPVTLTVTGARDYEVKLNLPLP